MRCCFFTKSWLFQKKIMATAQLATCHILRACFSSLLLFILLFVFALLLFLKILTVINLLSHCLLIYNYAVI